MSNSLTKRKTPETALDRARRAMEKSLGQLARLVDQPAVPRRHERQPRLFFVLDLTGSREWCLEEARIATAAMFMAIQKIGKVAVKLAYFRGSNECRESAWYDDPDILCRSMMGLGCMVGETKIEPILRSALRQCEGLSGVVYIGDDCEESHVTLEELAAELGKRGVPLFMFHERCPPEWMQWRTKRLFRRMAARSGGFYVQFKSSSHRVMSELLSNVAAYTADGVKGVERIELPTTAEAKALRNHLLLATGR